MKVVLDTNIILASVSPFSPYRIVFEKFEASEYTLCLTSEILLEYEEKLGEIFNETVAELTTAGLMLKTNILKVGVFYQWRLIFPDLDDNKFVDCAIAANADYLVTNDKDFNRLKTLPFPKIKVLNMAQFIEVLEGGDALPTGV